MFEFIPVRKQHAIKDKRKCIDRIKEVLQAYALARPYLRISMKVTGEPNQDWLYCPGSPATIQDAIMKIFGNGLFAHCVFAQGTMVSSGRPNLTLEAALHILPRNADSLKTIGAFVSVDARPLNSKQGIAKRIFAEFKSHIAKLAISEATSHSSPTAFMQLDIQCAPGSYDINVTPLKDEVLFHDEQSLLDCFRRLCERALSDGEKMNLQLGNSSKGCRNKSSTMYNATPSSAVTEARSCHKVTTDQDEIITNIEARSSIKVNMKRLKSNDTDEDSALCTVNVSLPPQSSFVTKCSSNRVKPSNRPGSGRKFQSLPGLEDIHQYLLPQSKLNFKIAEDDTATQPISNMASKANTLSCVPLRPVGTSTQNQLRRDPDSDPESLDEIETSDLGIPQPYRIDGSDISVIPDRRGTHLMERHSTEQLLSPGRNNIPVTPLPLPMVRRMPSPGTMPRGGLTLQTPPFTGPRGMRTETAMVAPPARTARAIAEPRSLQLGLQYELGDEQRPAVGSQGFPPRGRIWQSPMQSQDATIDATQSGTMLQLGLQPRRARYNPPGVQNVGGRRKISAGSRIQDDVRALNSAPPYSYEGDELRSHNPQTLLLEPSSSQDTGAVDHGVTKQKQSRTRGDRKITAWLDAANPAPEPASNKRKPSQQSQTEDGTAGDARLYLIKRKKFKELTGRPKRLASTLLPLESIQPDNETVALVTILDSNGQSCVCWLEETHVAHEYFRYTDCQTSIVCESMLEKEKAPKELEKVLSRWISSHNGSENNED
jgi:DNA mismatch repair ATPase MutL